VKQVIRAAMLVLLIPVICAAQDSTEAETQDIVASGLGSILQGDVAHARDDAIEDALRRGLEQAMGMMIEAESLVENFQLIEDNIYSKTSGYVQTYDVLREGKRNEQLYEVTLRARVKTAALQDDLDAIATLMRRKNTPRMMVMIQESNIGEAPGLSGYLEADMNNAETAIMDGMMAKGFRFVDQAVVKQNLDRSVVAAILEGDTRQAADLGRKVNAEVVITGKAMAKATVVDVYGIRQRSQQATVNVRAIRTDTGDIIATSSAQGAFPHIDDMVGGTRAIQKACEKITGDMVEKILNQWQADVSTGAALTLNVQNVADYGQLIKFKNALEYYVRNLTSVSQRDFSGGLATFEVVMTGNSDDLAQRLSGKTIEGIRISVIGMTQNSVTVRLSSASAVTNE